MVGAGGQRGEPPHESRGDAGRAAQLVTGDALHGCNEIRQTGVAGHVTADAHFDERDDILRAIGDGQRDQPCPCVGSDDRARRPDAGRRPETEQHDVHFLAVEHVDCVKRMGDRRHDKQPFGSCEDLGESLAIQTDVRNYDDPDRLAVPPARGI